MKRKTTIIILVAQTALMLYSFIYAYVQESIAQEQQMLAIENAKKAELNAEETYKLFKKVEQLEQQLSNCVGK